MICSILYIFYDIYLSCIIICFDTILWDAKAVVNLGTWEAGEDLPSPKANSLHLKHRSWIKIRTGFVRVLAYARRWELYRAVSCRGCHVFQIIPSNFYPLSRKCQLTVIFLEDSSHHPIIFIYTQILGWFGFSYPLSLKVTVGPCGTCKHHAVSQFDVDLFWQHGDVEIWGLMAFTYSTKLGLS